METNKSLTEYDELKEFIIDKQIHEPIFQKKLKHEAKDIRDKILGWWGA